MDVDAPAPARELPQHFRDDGGPKRKYESWADAMVAAHEKSDGEGWLVAYPCYCGAFHIGRPRPGVEYEIDEATIRIHLIGLWWQPVTVPHWRTGEPLARWMRPQGDTHVSLREAWDQVTHAAIKETRGRLGARIIDVPDLAGIDTREARALMRRTLIKAGWRPPEAKGHEWLPPRLNTPKTRDYKRYRYLDEAWAAFVARQQSMRGQTANKGASCPSR